MRYYYSKDINKVCIYCNKSIILPYLFLSYYDIFNSFHYPITSHLLLSSSIALQYTLHEHILNLLTIRKARSSSIDPEKEPRVKRRKTRKKEKKRQRKQQMLWEANWNVIICIALKNSLEPVKYYFFIRSSIRSIHKK